MLLSVRMSLAPESTSTYVTLQPYGNLWSAFNLAGSDGRAFVDGLDHTRTAVSHNDLKVTYVQSLRGARTERIRTISVSTRLWPPCGGEFSGQVLGLSLGLIL